MTKHFYEEIRAKKAIWGHEEVRNVIPFISQQLYSSRTQLIYELLQNAEDACIRLKRKGVQKDYFICFNLKPELLKIYHNGIPFDDDDVDSICSVLKGTKVDDELLIGKFGIGFKSVYKYTIEPKIHCNNESGNSSHNFCIKEFVLPYEIKPSNELNEGQTLIEIPFNQPDKPQQVAYKEIGQKLRNLNSRSLLFLNSISEITWTDAPARGFYRKTESLKDGYKEITLLNRAKDGDKIENWLLFEKHIQNDPDKPKVEIAFLLNDDKTSILRTKSSNLYAYFETAKDTKLHFLIHGPFRTTPARDNIRSDEWNEKIIEEIAQLIANILLIIRKNGLLNIEFLRTLPLDPENYYDTIFENIFTAVKDEILRNPYLPVYGGGYESPDKVFLAQITQLRELLTPLDLQDFYGKEGSWLDEEITERRTPDLRKYLLSELGVQEVTPDNLGRILTKENLSIKTDEWLSKLYQFLVSRGALWQKGSVYVREGIFRNRPIFRTADNYQTAAFDQTGNPLIYLPSDLYSSSIPTIKETFMKNHINVDFFNAFEIKSPDKTDYIISNILPKYRSDVIVEEEENVSDIIIICDTISNFSTKRKKDELISHLHSTKILYSINSLGTYEYKKPQNVYINKTLLGKDHIETFFNGYPDAWFIDNRYLDKVELEELKEIGLNDNIIVTYKQPDFSGYVYFSKSWEDHKRGIGNFDPDAQIHGLTHCLQNISLKKGQILWNLLKNHKDLIYGIVQKSSRQDFKYKDEEQKFSFMGKMLYENKWLPDDKGKFFKPSEIQLSELHDDLDKSSSDSKFISIKLHMKQEIDEEVLSKMSDTQRNLLQKYHMLSEEKQSEVLSYIQKLSEEDEDKPLPPVTIESVEEIREQFANRISSEDDKSLIKLHDEVFPMIMTQEDEEKLIKNYGENMGPLLHENVMRYRNSMKNEAVVVSRIPPKQYLISEYEGNCQICNTKLDLGKTKNPIIEIFRIQERRKRHPWADEPWNILGLCPNCHALAKQGGLNLQNLVRLANNIIIQETASEFIDEREKQGYLVDITIAMNSAQLFYTQRHMSYIAAFLFYDK